MNVQNCSDSNLKFILYCLISNNSVSHLNITNNTDCTNIPDLLNDLINIESLQIVNCNINSISDSIGYMKLLTNLNLQNLKNITFIPNSIGQLTNLSNLNIASLSIESIPEEINKLENLKYLKIENNINLRELPNLYLKNLNYLSICNNNNISKLPEIDSLQSLQTFELNEKSLEFLPDSIGKFIELITLSISNTNIKLIPNSIENCNNLKNLIVNNNNNLESLPENIGNIKSLISLKLSMNELIKTLPDSIGNLSNLQELLLFFYSDFILPRSFEFLLKNNILNVNINSNSNQII